MSHLTFLTKPYIIGYLMEIYMPLLPVYYTTTNLRKRKQRKHDRSEHDAWLAKMGLTPKQIKSKKTANTFWTKQYSESLRVERSTQEYEIGRAHV